METISNEMKTISNEMKAIFSLFGLDSGISFSN
jgi:hypothetical protein